MNYYEVKDKQHIIFRNEYHCMLTLEALFGEPVRSFASVPPEFFCLVIPGDYIRAAVLQDGNTQFALANELKDSKAKLMN